MSVRIATFVAAALLFAACGGTADEVGEPTATPSPEVVATPTEKLPTPTPTPAPEPAVSFTNENWGLALADPDKYKGSPVTLTGRVFTEPEVDEDLLCFQMWTDPENSEGNTAACAASTIASVASDDYVMIEGTLFDKFEGTNLFGGTLTVPMVLATSVEKTTRSEIIAPALVVIEVNAPQTQHGLTVTVGKVEIAAAETRVWVTISNASVEKASAYDFGALLVQGNRQFETKYSFDTGLPELPDAILPGIEASGVILFEPIDASTGQARLVWDGPRTDDYSLDFADWVWDFTW